MVCRTLLNMGSRRSHYTRSARTNSQRHGKAEKKDALNSETFTRLCCTNLVRDSSGESRVVAGMHEQTDTNDLQDQELAGL